MYFETLIDERIAISRNEWAQNGLDRLEVLPFPRLDAFKTNIKTFGSKYEAEKVVSIKTLSCSYFKIISAILIL